MPINRAYWFDEKRHVVSSGAGMSKNRKKNATGEWIKKEQLIVDVLAAALNLDTKVSGQDPTGWMATRLLRQEDTQSEIS